MSLSDREIAIRKRLRDDYPHYAERCLKIRTKAGTIVPLRLNRTQLHVDAVINQQLAKIGFVRTIMLKARQMGISTSIGGRGMWRVTHNRGMRADIITHEQAATDNLFGMTQRYYEHLPLLVRPSCGAATSKELYFDKLDSTIKTSTAGTRGVGRSATIQFLHGSEVAFWPHAHEHAQGIMQAVPREPGTEIHLESTANGTANYFAEQWQLAVKGLSEFVPIFVPWYWMPEYRKLPEEGIALTDEEYLLKATYDLDDYQIAWRRQKILELGGDAIKFKQEYPCSADEAFETSGTDVFVDIEPILRARKDIAAKREGALIIGVDPARYGDDRTAIIRRHGRVVYGKETYTNKSTMEVVGLVGKIINEERPNKVFVDVVGIGAGVYDRLLELGFHAVVSPVNAGERSSSHRYYNKRAEMWGEMREWLRNAPVSIPDDDELQADLRAPTYTYTSNQAIKLERKEDMRARGVKSPDIADALALTFAYPVAPTPTLDPDSRYGTINRYAEGAWAI